MAMEPHDTGQEHRLPLRQARTRSQRMQTSRRSQSRRWIWLLAGVALLSVLVFAAGSYYRTYVQPRNTWAAMVDGKTLLTMGDVVKQIRTAIPSGSASGQRASAGGAPYQVVSDAVQDELIRQATSQFGITTTSKEVDDLVRARFYAGVSEGDTTPPEQLDREYQARYSEWLTQAGLTNAQYRKQAEAEINRDKMRQAMSNRVPTVAEHVDVMWIVLPLSTGDSSSVDPTAVVQQLRSGANMGELARRVSTDPYPSGRTDQPAYLGWVPKGAYPYLDTYLFGDGTQGPGWASLEISDPLGTFDGVYVIKVLNGPEERRVDSDAMHERLANQALDQWLNAQWKQHDVQVRMDSAWYTWVMAQVR